jgi:hypothetical protein
MKGIQVCPDKGPGPLQRGKNHKNVKMGWGHLKIFSSRTTGPILNRLGTNHPWVTGVQVCSKEGDNPMPRGDNSERVKMHGIFFLKIFFSRITGPILTRLGTNHPWVKGVQVSLKEGDNPMQRGDNSKRVKIHGKFLKIFFSRITGPILTRLGTTHPWVKGVQVCSKEGDKPMPRGDNSERVKMHGQFLKIFLSRITGPILTRLGTTHPWVKGVQVCSKEGDNHSPRGENSERVKMH